MTRRSWLLKGFGVVAGAVVVLAGGLAMILYPQVLKGAPEPNYPPPVSIEEANRQDIDFVGRLTEIDRSFSPTARELFATGIIDLQRRAGSLSSAELEMEVARLAALAETLPENGHIFVLTGGNTYSAAIITAARLKYLGRDPAVIPGEPMGDRERFWAEGGRMALPNSGVQMGYATAMPDWKRGCRLVEIRDCYLINYVIGVPAGSLAPNEPVVPRFADYATGEDTALPALAARQRDQG